MMVYFMALALRPPLRPLPSLQMHKVYFLGVESLQPYQLQLEVLYEFNAEKRQMSQGTVKYYPHKDLIRDPILRIRCVCR